MKEFKGKVAVVVGSTGGIGKEVAQKFASEGANVVITGRNDKKGRAVVDEIKNDSGDAIFIRCDIKNEEDIEALMDSAVETYGKIDILIGNAGVPENKKPLHKMTKEDFMSVINVDLVGIVLANKYAVKKMLTNFGDNKGVIINIASILGVVADTLTTSYPASKAGIINFTRAQAVTYIKEGIRFNTVSPGYVETDLLDQLPKEVVDSMIAKHPIGRFAKPAEIADAVLYLAGEKSSFIVGENLVVDGGYTAI